MDTRKIEQLIRAYEMANVYPLGAQQRLMTIEVIKFGITAGYLAEVEQKNPYTFGGVTVRLTDTEFAHVVKHIQANRKIQAIKHLRVDITNNSASLKEAKDFADHLGSILEKASQI